MEEVEKEEAEIEEEEVEVVVVEEMIEEMVEGVMIEGVVEVEEETGAGQGVGAEAIGGGEVQAIEA